MCVCVCVCIHIYSKLLKLIDKSLISNIHIVGMVQFGLVMFSLVQFNYCRLFNAKSIFIHTNSSTTNTSIKTKYRVQFFLTHRQDAIMRYHSGPEWMWEQWESRFTFIPQRSRFNGISPSYYFVSYSGESLEGFAPLQRFGLVWFLCLMALQVI